MPSRERAVADALGEYLAQVDGWIKAPTLQNADAVLRRAVFGAASHHPLIPCSLGRDLAGARRVAGRTPRGMSKRASTTSRPYRAKQLTSLSWKPMSQQMPRSCDGVRDRFALLHRLR
jgi:hypothetical protein